jgi:CheY-like chemotaxis protein
MIRYMVADDDEQVRDNLGLLLQQKIGAEFGEAQGTFCATVDEAVKSAAEIGSDLQLIILDMNFGERIGGLQILKELNSEQRRSVVVYSAYLSRPIPPMGKTIRDVLITDYGFPPERMVDTIQMPAGLWPACVRVLDENSKRR